MQPLPREVAGMNDECAEEVACGKDFTVVLTESGRIVTFGCGKYGALGQNALGSSSRPMTIKETESEHYADVRFAKVKAGWAHCLALSEEGKVYYWGNQFHARNRREDICKVPRVVEGFPRCSVIDVACGFDHCVTLGRSEFDLSQFHVFTWGCNDHGQLGYATQGNLQPQAVEVAGAGEGLVDAGAGRHYTAVLRSNGEVLAWGQLPCLSSSTAPCPTVVHRASAPSQKSSALVCGVEQIWLLREADYSYSVATMLDSPEEAEPRHQRAVSHDAVLAQRESEA